MSKRSRAMAVLRERPPAGATYSRAMFRVHVAALRVGREVERAWSWPAFIAVVAIVSLCGFLIEEVLR